MRLRFRTATEVRRSLSRVANMVLNDEITTKQANTIIYASNAILEAIKTDEQQKKLAELEQLLNEIKR